MSSKKTTKKVPAKQTKKAPAKKAAKKIVSDGRRHTSAIESPVAYMWDLCEKMKNKRRRDVLKVADAAGVAYWTARSQYAMWSQASRGK